MAVLRECYYLLFYALYQLDPVGSSRAYNKWKALLGMSVIQILLLAILDLWCAMTTGADRFLGLPRYVIGPVGGGIVFLNYMTLLHRSQWETYEKKFSQYPSRGRKLRMTLSLVFVALVVAMLFYSFHRYGKWVGRA